MKTLPTDLKMLDTIYERYYKTFAAFSEDNKNRTTKNFVSIDIKKIAEDMKVDPDIIFGRLYYHMEQKYGYKQEDGSNVHFFTLAIGNDRHCINFPYMASVLAELREKNRKYRIATTIAIFSLFVSVIALLLSIFI